jgi:maleate isomerase
MERAVTEADEILPLAARCDGGPTRYGAVGLLALATDHVCEGDLRRVLPQDRLPLYVSRVAIAMELSVDALAAMKGDIARATALLLPESRLDVIAYGCTSGTMVIGEDIVFAEIRKVRPAIACTTPPTASLAAFAALGLKRIAVLAPYPHAVNLQVRHYLQAHGLDVPVFGGFNKSKDADIAAISVDSIVESALLLDRPDIDGLFLSCTGLRAIDAVARVEAMLGKPVVSSNQALAWHAMRLAGCRDHISGFGRLLSL